MEKITVFCPATIANVSCGFDVLGMALEDVGDLMTVRKIPDKGIVIEAVHGQELPLEAHKNVAGITGMAMLHETNYAGGFAMSLEKKIKAGSGIGSSAASAAGAAWAMNELLGKPFDHAALTRFAMEGEKLASGVAHADNVAPAIFGGITLVRSYDPLDIISIPVPADLYATIIHPQIEIRTADSRKILKTTFSLADGIKQWGNLGGLIAGFYTSDYELIGRSLHDHIVEPIRSILIPGFDQVKAQVLEAGALGCGISGSGPSIFALSKGRKTAESVAEVMRSTYEKIGLPFEIHVSGVSAKGVRQITTTL